MLCVGLALTAGPATSAPAQAPNVVTYQCDSDRRLVVAYPPYADVTKEPIRLAWNGQTYMLQLAPSGSGARYTSKTADLQWWNKGRGGFLNRLSTDAPLVTNCNES